MDFALAFGAGEACFQQGLPRKLQHSVSSMSLLGLEQATRHCHKSTQPMCQHHSLYSPYTLRNIDHHYPSLDLCLLIFLPFSPCWIEMDMFNVFNAEPSVVVLPCGSLGAHPETSNVWTSEPASCILSDLHGDWYVIYICVCLYRQSAIHISATCLNKYIIGSWVLPQSSAF